ncbi:hypothetical protein EHS25_000414 [Saitozyma podzolica]|uniref:MARVEL domain-containing protein n=1 Tax=Saitozyma podzolica TaxID=1890683 RepID=A0A427YW60_9TREE|nr:hypothetical protein EHS25_000414 [Saitozyma podzolica]
MASSVRPAVRYTLMGLHMALWLTIFLVGLLLAFNIVYFIVHIAAGIALIIYVPAAIALSARDSESTFDHAGGEVAYLVIQQIAWLFSGVWSALIAAWASVCYDVTYTRGRYTYHRNGVCAVVIAISALSFLHFVILLGWMSWVIHIARTSPGLSATKGFAMPTHKLLVSPPYDREPVSMSERSERGERGQSRGQAEQYSTPFPTAQVAHDDATGVARVDRGYQLTSATEAEREAELMSHAEGWQHQGAGETR